tara:strand:+ start:3436 stop:3852 length:417 start_codon:yes stop_codon:yes gene_type:complete
MKTEEKHHIRDLRMSRWVRALWPDNGSGFVAIDVDFVLRNYNTKRLALVEVKCRGARPTYGQSETLRLLDEALKAGMPNSHPAWVYEGVWVVRFEREVPGDGGRIWIDDIEVNDEQLHHAFKHIVHPSRGVAMSENEV